MNLLLRSAAAVGVALSIAVGGGAVTAAAIDDLIALFTRDALTGGGTPLYGRLEEECPVPGTTMLAVLPKCLLDSVKGVAVVVVVVVTVKVLVEGVVEVVR